VPTSFALLCYQQGGLSVAIEHIRKDIIGAPRDTMLIAIPALLYTIQNNCLFVGVGNLEAVIFQVTYQLKTLFTAVFTVCMLIRTIKCHQWAALLLLICGALLVQAPADAPAPALVSPPPSPPPMVGLAAGVVAHQHFGHARHGHHGKDAAVAGTMGRMLGELAQAPASSHGFVLGISATIVACVCSSLASVFLEKVLTTSKPSLWVRNIQLCLFTIPIAYSGTYAVDDAGAAAGDWLHGFTNVVWATIAMNALGGMLVALVMKFAGNILRNFAQACAIIVGSVGSAYLFDFQVSGRFLAGVALVIASIFLYGATEEQACCHRARGMDYVPATPASPA
jgi:UDP-sugar transporter A1/2/3